MRTGILEQLPRLDGKKVLVVGPRDGHGYNHLRQNIATLNRQEDWIIADFRDKTPETIVTPRFALVLCLAGMNHSVVGLIRKAARDLEIVCLNQILTASEVRTILRELSAQRTTVETSTQEDATPKPNGSSNGSEHKVISSSKKITSPAESPATSSDPAGSNGDSTTPDSPPDQDSQSEPDLTSDPIAVLEKIGPTFEAIAFAVELIQEENGVLKEQVAEHEAALAEKDKEVIPLQKTIEEQRESISDYICQVESLTTRIQELEAELRKNGRLVEGLRKLMSEIPAT